ncbi:MAG: transcriptional regulator [Gammaproteobacteria bacterium]|nr:transcriptional regulator [Gammaproteobacteria bacterium]
MKIEGPMKITIADPADGQGKLLMIQFTPEFQALGISAQAAGFRQHIGSLQDQISAITSEVDRNRAGMMIILQFAEQLLPHIEQGELALEEQIVLQIRQAAQVVALTDLLA